MCKYGPTAFGIIWIKLTAIASSIPVSFNTPKNIPAAIITAAIISAFGAGALSLLICSSTFGKLIIKAIATLIINANSGGAILASITTMIASVSMTLIQLIQGLVTATPRSGNLIS